MGVAPVLPCLWCLCNTFPNSPGFCPRFLFLLFFLGLPILLLIMCSNHSHPYILVLKWIICHACKSVSNIPVSRLRNHYAEDIQLTCSILSVRDCFWEFRLACCDLVVKVCIMSVTGSHSHPFFCKSGIPSTSCILSSTQIVWHSSWDNWFLSFPCA